MTYALPRRMTTRNEHREMNTDTPTDDRPSQAEALAEQLRGDNATGAVEIVKVFAAGGSEGSNLLVEQVPIG